MTQEETETTCCNGTHTPDLLTVISLPLRPPGAVKLGTPGHEPSLLATDGTEGAEGRRDTSIDITILEIFCDAGSKSNFWSTAIASVTRKNYVTILSHRGNSILISNDVNEIRSVLRVLEILLVQSFKRVVAIRRFFFHLLAVDLPLGIDPSILPTRGHELLHRRGGIRMLDGTDACCGVNLAPTVESSV